MKYWFQNSAAQVYKCLVILVVVLASCSLNTKSKRVNDVVVEFNSGENRNKCITAGGQPRGYTMVGFVCMWPASDAGKKCLSNSDCEGICEVPASFDSIGTPGIKRTVEDEELNGFARVLPVGKPATGECAAEKAIVGKANNCGMFVENGVIRIADCYD